jgi:hypothetical protein
VKKIPEQLVKRQESQRQQTINKVLYAIDELEREGYRIKVKDLIERTGLARSTFSKTHIREILIQKCIIEMKEGDPKDRKSKTNKKTRIGNLKQELDRKEAYIERLLEEKEVLKNECELLRGRLFLLMQRLQNYEK